MYNKDKIFCWQDILEHSKQKTDIFLADNDFVPPPHHLADMTAKNVRFSDGSLNLYLFQCPPLGLDIPILFVLADIYIRFIVKCFPKIYNLLINWLIIDCPLIDTLIQPIGINLDN